MSSSDVQGFHLYNNRSCHSLSMEIETRFPRLLVLFPPPLLFFWPFHSLNMLYPNSSNEWITRGLQCFASFSMASILSAASRAFC